MSVILRNPHSVLAVLANRPGDIQEIAIPSIPSRSPAYSSKDKARQGKGHPLNEVWQRVVNQAQELGVKVVTRTARRGAGSADEESQRMATTEAVVRERSSVSLEEIFRDAKGRRGGCGLWIMLDTLQDPHNVGAIFRTAAFFSVEGIILTQDRSAPMTGTVYDVASGGVESVPFVSQTNLQNALKAAKEAGIWILGTSEHAYDSLESIERDRPWLLVLGNEEKGMRRLTEESCDLLCKIPGTGKVSSLNVAVSAGIFISRLSKV